MSAALDTVERVLEDSGWQETLLEPATISELPCLAGELLAGTVVVAVALGRRRLPPVPRGLVERETLLAALNATAAGQPLEGELRQLAVEVAADLAVGLGRGGSLFSDVFAGGDTLTTFRFSWTSRSVWFQAFYGEQDIGNEDGAFASFGFEPNHPEIRIPQRANKMSPRINLWLRGGTPPSDGKPVEVVVRSFDFASLY